MRISVIVPVYNVEKTLRRCIASIVRQNVDSMEIIMVNDGSTDGSLGVAEDIIKEHDCVTLISQKNGGLSDARNTGIEACTGDYITFVDSDDWLMDNTYAPLLRIMDTHTDCDILEYKPIANNGTQVEYDCKETTTYTSARDYWLKGKAYRHTYACNKIFRRRLLFHDALPDIRFIKGKLFEDVYFLSELLTHNPQVIVTPTEGYVYFNNTEGITANPGTKGYEDLLAGHLRAAELLQMKFMQADAKVVAAEETDYYLAVLNIQICAYKYSCTHLSLPSRRISLRVCPRRVKTWIKVIILNVFGIRMFQRRYN